jgi:mannose-6-phosphate isomerase-like protein (cupin superfamily)
VSEVFELDQLQALQVQAGRSYLEFVRVPAMSAGIYVLPVGGNDPQSPHSQDEIYYVISGAAKVRLGKDEQRVEQGSVIFVEAGLEHRFFDIEQELLLFVVFAPAESS